MKGDLVEILVDTGGGVQRFEVTATRAGRRIEVATARGVVEVSEVTRSGVPVRSARFMASRVVALVEHPSLEVPVGGVEETTRRRLGRQPETADGTRGRRRRGGGAGTEPDQLELLGGEPRESAAASRGEEEIPGSAGRTASPDGTDGRLAARGAVVADGGLDRVPGAG